MAVEISSFIRAWCLIKFDPITNSNSFEGNGVKSVTRSAVGQYDVVLDEVFDAQRSTIIVTNEQSVNGLGAYTNTETDEAAGSLAATTVKIRAFEPGGVGIAPPVDVSGVSLVVFAGAVEATIQSVAP